MSWPEKSQALTEKITRNVHDWFGLQDTQKLQDPTTGEEETVGALLSELAQKLAPHEEAPFTCERLEELAELSPTTKNHYDAGHGAAYLRAAIKLAHVVSPSAVFREFNGLLEQQSSFNIKLEPIEWARMRAPSPARLSADASVELDKQSERSEPDPPEPEPKKLKLSKTNEPESSEPHLKEPETKE